MKVCKPLKVPVLTRVVHVSRRPVFHVTAVLAFPLMQPRALVDEFAFWQAVTPELGASVFDEGVSKARGELLVVGRCFAGEARARPQSFVRVQCGTVEKKLAVFGDRHRVGGTLSEPRPFTEMPIDWPHAYGGSSDARNPFGKGVEEVEFNGQRVFPLPNVEPMTAGGETTRLPASFAPMDVSFAARRARAGTFGANDGCAYAPGLPPDHDPTFFNLASDDQWIPGFWAGDETFVVENMHPQHARMEGRLPGLSPRAFVTQKKGDDESFRAVDLRCDTVWLLPTIGLGAVLFHGSLPLEDDDARDIVHLVVACEEPNAPRSVAHYQDALRRRLDKEKGSLADLSDGDLMPPRESGVTPNMDLGPIGQWLKPSSIAEENERRGAERRRELRAAELRAEGIDPGLYGLTTPLPPVERPPHDDLDALARYFEQVEGRIAEAEAKAKQDSAMVADQQRTLLAAEGIDPDAAEEPDPPGPPTFRAQARLEEETELALAARAAGHPNLEAEDRLANPRYRESLVRLEELMREGYRTSAHMLPAANPMTEEASAMAKLVVGMAKEADESLAGRDFTGADFRGLDLSGMRFERALLEAADLRGANLAGANLEGAVLAKADLRGATVTHARLRGANLGGANLEGANLDQSDLAHCTLSRASTVGASFRGTNLEAADILEVNWRAVDLRGARFDRCTFMKSDLTEATLAEASLEQTTFLECTLDDTSFERANLRKASVVSCRGARTSFIGADAREAVFVHRSELLESRFDGANLERTCMRTTVLRSARFDHARMAMSDISECDATGASFERAMLKSALAIRAVFERASFRGANLTEALLGRARIAAADFTGAQLTRADLSGAVGDDHTSFKDATVAWLKLDKHAINGRDS